MSFTRYAVYYTPPPGALAEFGAKWLGWDIWAGRAVAHPHIPGLPNPIANITAKPHRYGFHATLRPPFRLAPDTTEDDLHAALSTLCAQTEPVLLQALELRRIESFLALVPMGETQPLYDLAARLVQGLDRFRAPPDKAELARRRATGLTPRQEAQLVKWGYPYVMEEFRFHMTLTGPLGAAELDVLRPTLAPMFSRLVPAALRLSDVTLVGEDPSGRFHALHRCALTGHASPCQAEAAQPLKA